MAEPSDPVDLDNVDFHEIARRGDTEVMQAFLQAGLDPGLQDPRGYDLLMIAAYAGQADMVELLLEHGADPDARNGAGATALHMAAMFRQEELLELLLERGADTTLVDAQGHSPAALARAHGHYDLAERIEDAQRS